MYKDVDVSELIGKTFTKIDGKEGDDVVLFIGEKSYQMYHYQDCCEVVWLEEVHGDLQDLVGTPIIEAEEVSNADGPPKDKYSESYTWTFYKFRTLKGDVTLRWYGESNGYYSEEVSIKELTNA